jgi:predicted LPLAT superfamily acyltransferase
MPESTAEWTQAPERGANWAMRILLFALNILGYTVARVFLIPIAAYFVITGGQSRRASRAYLARLHAIDQSAPKPTLFQVYLHHLEFAHVLMERALLWQGKTKKFQFSGHGKELLEGSGKLGLVLLGAHFGSFDALRILAKEMNCRVNVVMYRAHAQKINKLLQDLNPDTNVQVIEMTPGDTEGVLKLKQCIERGEHVAMLADRLAPVARQRAVEVDFLGAKASFPEGPWLLASVFACPVIFVSAARTGPRSYYVSVDQLADAIVRQPQILQGHIQKYARRLETHCRRYPRQWFNFYDFWNLPPANKK